MDNANGTFPSYKALSGLPQSQDFPLFFLSPRQGKQSLPHAERSCTGKGCYRVAQEQRLWGIS